MFFSISSLAPVI